MNISEERKRFQPERCPVCKGRGLVNWEKETCGSCNGTGVVVIDLETGLLVVGGQNDSKFRSSGTESL